MLRNKTLFLGLLIILSAGFALGATAIPNWPAPAVWTPPAARGLTTLSVTNPLAFQGLTPCRAADTRGNGFVGQYGPPSIGAGGSRTMTLTGVCGISADAVAVSLNVTITDISDLGDVRVFPAGGSAVVSTQNWTGSTGTIANAAVVPLGTGGAVTFTIDGFAAVDLIVDVNGYYAQSSPSASFEWDTAGSVGIVGRSTATTGVSFGVVGQESSLTDGSAGVHGSTLASTGIISGVLGESISTSRGAAGVIGSAGGAPNANYTQNLAPGGIGVLGLNTGNYAIAGVSDFIAGNFVNVSGTGTTMSKLQFGLAAHAIQAYGNVAISAWAAGSQLGDLSVAGTLTKGGGAFKIDDPIDPANKYLYHSFVESPDMMNIYNGNVVLDHNGEAVVTLPDYFEALNMDFRYQLTSVGKFSPVYVAEEIQNNQFVISGGRPYGKVSWQVTGIRHDPFANANRIPNEVEKEQAAKGYYLHPAAYGKGPEMDLSTRLNEAAAAKQEK